MRQPQTGLREILDELESSYGPQQPGWPTDAYDFLVWWHCGYPASDTNCAKGWAALNQQVGVRPRDILEAGNAKLARALASGGMVPELRALRLLQITSRVQDQFGGDLRGGLVGSAAAIRKTLKTFPNIADPGADRMLLFGGISPAAAVPSNCPHVLIRLLRGAERLNYGVNYREAQQLIEDAVPATFDARCRVFLLLKEHGQSVCKRTNPKCDRCAVCDQCAFFRKKSRGRRQDDEPKERAELAES